MHFCVSVYCAGVEIAHTVAECNRMTRFVSRHVEFEILMLILPPPLQTSPWVMQNNLPVSDRCQQRYTV